MKNCLFILLLILSFSSYAEKYNMKLTFVDGYNNKAIGNERVTVRIVNLDWSKEFTTDSKGSIEFNFNAEHFIKYNFRFESGNYQFQTRERYLGDDLSIDLTFEMYPSKKYEKSINENESNILDRLTEAPDSLDCIESKFATDFLTENFVDENMQLPYWYGDYGFKVEFLVQVVFSPTGKPCQVEIIESSDHNLNEEIIRLVRLIPESDKPVCGGQFKKTVQFPIVIDHRMDIWEE